MKKAFKFLGLLMLLLLILVALGAFLISRRGIPSYPVQVIKRGVISSPKSVSRGKKLALMLCANCHRDHSTGKLTGGWMKDAPPEFGKIYAPNITKDSVYGIGSWTAGELTFLLRTGIKKNGKYAPPYMAKLPNMADSDIDAIIAFLKSEDELVQEDMTHDQPSEPSFLTKVLCTIAFKPLPMPEEPIPLPDPSDQLALGKYLSDNLECFSCHSANFKTNDFLNPEKSKGFYGGGNTLLNKGGEEIVTPNITPDIPTGIGSWSKQEFVQAVKYGIRRDEKGLRYPMMPYTQLTDEEAEAIYAYLRTVPSIKNEVSRSQ